MSQNIQKKHTGTRPVSDKAYIIAETKRAILENEMCNF